MPRAARRGDLSTGNDTCKARPAREGSPDVMFNDQPALRAGDGLVPHTCAIHGPRAGKTGAGSATIFVNDLPVTRVGDEVDCGGHMSSGSDDIACEDDDDDEDDDG
jgi:uncharacterized Zn-binding protein involved in type VI secretion